MMHGAGDLADPLEVVEHLLVAIDVRFEYFPIVDARLARRSGIDQHEAPVQLFRRDADRGMVNAIGIKMNGAHAAIQSGIVILASGGNLDELGFNVLRDHANLLAISFLPVKRASAAVVAIISADEPEMPAPAGDSECVSISKPPSGAKKRAR